LQAKKYGSKVETLNTQSCQLQFQTHSKVFLEKTRGLQFKTLWLKV